MPRPGVRSPSSPPRPNPTQSKEVQNPLEIAGFLLFIVQRRRLHFLIRKHGADRVLRICSVASKIIPVFSLTAKVSLSSAVFPHAHLPGPLSLKCSAAIRQTPMTNQPFPRRQIHPFPLERIRRRPIVEKSDRD